MDISMPASFPMDEFRAFGLVTTSFYGHLMDEKNLFDPEEKKRNFDWACQAVRYRFRSCAESADEFKRLITDPNNAWWRAGGSDEELVYRLDTNGLSVFESFAFALYFLGGALQPRNFPHVTTLRKITLPTTSNAFAAAFPGAAITTALADLLKKAEFNRIERIRNLLAHRVSGRRSIRGGSDGTAQWHEETWHIPGSSDTLQFSEEMLHGLLHDITSMLTKLVAVARPFAEGQPVQIGRPDL